MLMFELAHFVIYRVQKLLLNFHGDSLINIRFSLNNNQSPTRTIRKR